MPLKYRFCGLLVKRECSSLRQTMKNASKTTIERHQFANSPTVLFVGDEMNDLNFYGFTLKTAR